MSVSWVLNRWLKRLYKLLAILLVVFAVLISTLRLFLPYAHNYRQNVEDFINTSYNSNIYIGALSMGWRKSGPTLITEHVVIMSGEHSKIYLERLEVELNFWRSLRTGQLVTQDFIISGAELEFEQSTLVNSAEEITTDGTGNDALIDSLSSILLEQISRFSIRDSHVLYHTLGGVRAFTINEMSWVNEDDRHRANGTVIVDGLSSNNLKVLSDFQGQRFDNFTGQAYLEANEIDITPWLGRVLAIKDANTHSAINFNAWLNISAGKPDSVQLALGNNEITWQHLGQRQRFEVIGGDVEIKTKDQALFSVATSPITIKRNGTETNKITLLANVGEENSTGYINAIELASFAGISPLLFDDVSLEKLLLDLDADGRFEDIYFRTSADELAITAKFSDIDSHFSLGIPGIDNVSGEIIYFNRQLQIALRAVDGTLDFAQHFKYPIPYTRLSSLINAQFLGDDWQFSVENIAFESPQLNLNADLQVNSVKGQPITMALLASATEGNAKSAEYFYPHLLMGEDLVDYLNGAIVDGKIQQALVLFNGPLQNFPFNNHEGVFVVDAELSESTFKFDSEWPAIENFAANLNFTNDSMVITGREGTLTDINVTGVTAAIASLSGEQVLTVDAAFNQTQPQRVRQLMGASPMRDSIGVTLAQVIISEPINGDFSLILPLNQPDAVIAKGYVDFNNNSLALQAPRMDFTQVNGRLTYHNDLIAASGIELDWRGLPLTINVKAQQKVDHYNVSIETLGQWENAVWQKQLPSELVQYANGQVDWQGLLSLNISDDKFNYDYQINSTLNDVALVMPAPFNKDIGEQVAVSIHAIGDDLSSTINAEIGEQFDFYGLLDHQATHFSWAHLVLGKQQSWLPTAGFHITADLTSANYQQWQPLVLDILAALEPEPREIIQAEDSLITHTSEQGLLSVPNKIHGQIGNLNVYGEDFQLVNFDFVPAPNWWLLNVNAKEIRAAAKFYPDWHQQGIDIDADFLHLKSHKNELAPSVLSATLGNSSPQASGEKNSTNAISTTSDLVINSESAQQNETLVTDADEKLPFLPVIDQVENSAIFAAMPPLKVRCRSCKYGHYDFGDVAFSIARENKNTLLVNKFTANRGKNNIAFDAKWQQENNSSKTSVSGILQASNVAVEAERIGYVSIIKDSGVDISYDATWQGGPHDFAIATLNGTLSTKFDDGYLADVDDKGVRILSFLSLQSLVRKLSFDFRDIFSDGMFYSELQGSFTVKDGVAYTDNVLMQGTAGDLTIVGNTNLNNGDLDYRMTYKPNLTSSLPVLAWIATLNPVTFLAGMALDEVITSTVIAEINFEVTGNLDEPQFKQVSRKNKNISVGRSSPPKIVESVPGQSVDKSPLEKSIKPTAIVDNFDG